MMTLRHFNDAPPVDAQEDPDMSSNETEIAVLRHEMRTLGQALRQGRATDTEAINQMRASLDKYIPWIEAQMQREQWYTQLRREVMAKVMTAGIWGVIVGLAGLIVMGVAHWIRETVAK